MSALAAAAAAGEELDPMPSAKRPRTSSTTPETEACCSGSGSGSSAVAQSPNELVSMQHAACCRSPPSNILARYLDSLLGLTQVDEEPSTDALPFSKEVLEEEARYADATICISDRHNAQLLFVCGRAYASRVLVAG
jgi:hypothetical protein